MYCRNCGQSVQPEAVACLSCGVPPLRGTSFCQACGEKTTAEQVICLKCGVALGGASAQGKSKLTAGVLGVLLGGLGIHRFYLGYTTIGIIQAVLGVAGIVTCGITSIISWIWGLVEGIMILTGSINKDAQGNPLREEGW